MASIVTREMVVDTRNALPVFPRVIDEILMRLDEPDTSLDQLVRHVERDPVLCGRIFALANSAAARTRRDSRVRDLFTATSLIGLSKLRETVIVTSLSGFLRGALPVGMAPGFWEHSAATGVCAQQLAILTHQPADPAMIAGLLHDIGQLWLFRFEPEKFSAAWARAGTHETTIAQAEKEQFGVDHTEVGAWLAESWELPPAIVAAIRGHHAPDAVLDEPLVAVVHVAEVLSNALDLSSGNARVTYLSGKACEQLGLTWDESAEAMFGRIEAVTQFLGSYYKDPAIA